MNSSNSRACGDDGEEPHPLVDRFATTASGQVNEEFTVPVHAAGGFGVAATALARKLAWLTDRGGQHNVYLSTPRLPSYYTQCLVDPTDGVWIEAVSNEFIVADEDRLGTEEKRVLADIGFHDPDADADADADGSPNHWLVLAPPVDWAEAAALLTAPLVLVYGLTELDELVVEICPHWRND